MRFEDILSQVSETLQRECSISYGAVKHQFDLEDDELEGLIDQLICTKKLVKDADNRVLMWVHESVAEDPPAQTHLPPALLPTPSTPHATSSQSKPPSPWLPVPASADFVGRQHEMGQMTAALAEVLSGQGRVVVLAGESGIGKTRALEELAVHAEVVGVKALWGRCPEERGAPPYWPWMQAIRTYMAGRDAETLRAEMGDGAVFIAEIVAELRGKLPNLQPPPALDPEQARFRLFDAITTFLKNASSVTPLVIILDDLHWADASSLRLLAFCAHEMGEARLLVLGTYRDVEVSPGHPLFRTLGELTRQRLFHRVPLLGLSREEVGQAIAMMGGITPPQELVTMVYWQTDGNPLFVGEVVRLLAQQGRLVPERLHELRSWTFRLPEGIREVITRRVERLSQPTNQVLTVAAVIGREFDHALLCRLHTELAEEHLLEGLDKALEAHVIQEMPGKRTAIGLRTSSSSTPSMRTCPPAAGHGSMRVSAQPWKSDTRRTFGRMRQRSPTTSGLPGASSAPTSWRATRCSPESRRWPRMRGKTPCSTCSVPWTRRQRNRWIIRRRRYCSALDGHSPPCGSLKRHGSA